MQSNDQSEYLGCFGAPAEAAKDQKPADDKATKPSTDKAIKGPEQTK